MKIYLAVRWGSDESGGPNEEDTNCLVRASSLDEAARVVDDFLANRMTHEKVEPICHELIELGEDASGKRDSAIVGVPWIAFSLGNVSQEYAVWSRGAETEYKWTPLLRDAED